MQTHHPEMRTRLMNGKILQFTLREMRDLFQSRELLGFIVAMWLAITLVNPYFFASIPGFSSRAFYWGTMMAVYTLIFPLYAVTAIQIWGRFTKSPIPHPLVSLPLLIALTWLSTMLPIIFGDWVPPRTGTFSLQLCIQNWLITVFLESLGIYFYWPRRPQNRAANAMGNILADQNVTIGKVIIATANIKSASSDGHFLKIHTASGEKDYRARMKDFLAQLSSTDGISSHRSHWVARDQISEVRKNMIVTISGAQIPISRGRKDIVQAWAKEYM